MAKSAKAFAANEAAKEAAQPKPQGNVKVRITEFGAGKVSSGQHEPGEGDLMLEQDEVVELPASIANRLRKAGLAEAAKEAK